MSPASPPTPSPPAAHRGGSGPPRPLTPCFGRQGDVAGLIGDLGAERLITVLGPGGLGKTRLAAEVANALLVPAATPAYATDGVWWIPLDSLYDDGEVAAFLASCLPGLDDRTVSAPDRLAELLSERELVLVLDNCEHVRDGAAETVSALLTRCAGVRILATSRSPLQVSGERLWTIAPLSCPDTPVTDPDAALRSDAVQLFVERATRARRSFVLDESNTAAVGAVCTALEGLPLAIELAASRCRLQTPAQILHGLTDMFTVLAAGPSDVPERQRSIEASIRWSYELLPESARRALRRLSVCAEGCTDEAVAALVGAGDAFTAVETLVDHSLLHLDDQPSRPPRYRMLSVVHEFARRELAADPAEEAEARTCHAEFYVALAGSAGPVFFTADHDQALAAVQPELENIRLALHQFLAQSRFDEAASAVAAISWMVSQIRHLRALAKVYDESLVHATLLQPRTRAVALVGRGGVRMNVGEYLGSMADFAAGLHAARAAGEPVWEADALCGLGYPGVMLDASVAVGNFRQAAELVSVPGVRRYPSASDEVNRSAALFQRCHALLGIALAQGLIGDVDAYRSVLDEIGPLVGALGHAQHNILYFLHRAWLARFEGRWRDVFAATEQVYEVGGAADEHSETRIYAWYADCICAEVALRSGQDHPALARLDELRLRAERTGKAHLSIPVAGVVMRRHLQRGEYAEAIALGRQLNERELAAGVALYAAIDLEVVAAAHQAQGDLDLAREALAQARALSRAMRTHPSMGILTMREASVARASGDLAAAESLAHETLQVQHRAGIRRELASVLELLAGVALDLGSPVEATRLFGAAAAERDRLDSPARCPPERIQVAADLDALTQLLEAETFAVAWAEGAATAADEAVAYATRARGERRRPSFGWDSLTPTERQVVSLVAEGKTNPQIAAKLFVGRETVKTHLKSVFAKLGVNSRSEVAAVVARHDSAG